MYDPYAVKISKCAKNFIPVTIPEEYKNDVKKLAERIVAVKSCEAHHRLDNNAELKRFTNGLLGEAALEILLGVDIIDWEEGDSAFFDHPDIPGYKVGIKTVEYGKFPIIPKRNQYPQIICLITPTKVFVCGLATEEVLNTFQDDNFIVDPYLKARGVKTAFTGFDKLIHIEHLQDLVSYKK